jgi:gliding motility-associated-like protein
VSGTAYFKAANPGNYVLGFEAVETDKLSGIFLSSIKRDVQVKVFDCTAPPPRVDSIPGDLFSSVPTIKNATIVNNPEDTGYYIYACPGSDISIEVNAIPDYRDDPGNINNIIYLRHSISGLNSTPTFTVTGNGTNHAKGVFAWTPTVDDYGDHALIVTAVDTTCDLDQPIVLFKERVFNIRIARGLDAGDDRPVCKYNGKPVQLFVKNAEGVKLQWTNLDGSPATSLIPSTEIENPLDTLLKPITEHAFVVASTDLVGNCKSKDTVVVYVDTTNTIDIVPQNPYVLCRPDYLQLDAVTKGARPLTNLPCGTANPISCAPQDLLVVPIMGSPSYGKGTFYDTLGPTTPTFPNYEVRTSKQQYFIPKGDLWDMGLRSSTIRSISIEIVDAKEPNHPYDNFKISMKCTGKDSLSKTTGFENFMTTVYSSATPVTFGTGVKEFVLDQPYTWDTTANLIIEICYSNNTYISVCNQILGTAPFLKFVPTEKATTLSLRRYFTTADVCPIITHDSIQTTASRPLFTFKVCEPDNVPFEFRWSGLDPTGRDSSVQFLSDSTIQQPLAYVPKSITYYVETKGRSSCLVKDSIAIYVPEHNYALIPKDTVICYGETANMRVNAGFDFKWYEYINGQYIPATSVTCFNCREVELKPEVTTTYKVVVYDSVWCIDTLTTTIKVLPLPDIRIVTNDTIIKYGQSIQLLATGARMYNWTPVAPLNNANISYPIARPTESTRFVAGGIGANGCRAFDTLNVSVDTRDNLFVPSGFSPNGDGKNDLFRIANLTFQRIIEFRVFNRWGQEIFNTNNNNGWDGTWKGQAQEVGNYSYQIRIGFPDGYVESYKGEVTLVR